MHILEALDNLVKYQNNLFRRDDKELRKVVVDLMLSFQNYQEEQLKRQEKMLEIVKSIKDAGFIFKDWKLIWK